MSTRNSRQLESFVGSGAHKWTLLRMRHCLQSRRAPSERTSDGRFRRKPTRSRRVDVFAARVSGCFGAGSSRRPVGASCKGNACVSTSSDLPAVQRVAVGHWTHTRTWCMQGTEHGCYAIRLGVGSSELSGIRAASMRGETRRVHQGERTLKHVAGRRFRGVSLPTRR